MTEGEGDPVAVRVSYECATWALPSDRPQQRAWYRHMSAAVKAGGLSPDDELEMLRYVVGTSLQLTNRA